MKNYMAAAAFAAALTVVGCVGNSGGASQSEHMNNANTTANMPAAPDNTTVNDQVGTLRDTMNQTRVSGDTTGQGTTQRTGPGNSAGTGEPVGQRNPARTDGTRSGNATSAPNNGGQ